MRIHSHALIIVLGACALSPSTLAFLHSPPRASTLAILRANRRSGPQRRTTSLSEGGGHSDDVAPSLISQLAFYPSDEESTLSERLKNVQTEWDNVKRDGIGKFFSDELEAAERIIRGNADRAESGAEEIITKGESDDYLLKDSFHGMVDTGKVLASEMKEVRQEFDELKAAKIVERAAEDIVETTVLVEKDLEKVVGNVVASLAEAEEAVQSAIAAIASKEGLTDAIKADLSDKLETKAQNIEESMRVADSVAKTAKQIAVEDEKVMAELERTGDRLSDAIDATGSLAGTLKGTEGGAAVDAVSNTVDRTAAIVREDLSAAEGIADAVGRKVIMEADAVLAVDERAAGSVAAVRAAGSSIRESKGGADGSSGGDDGNESLTSALTKDASEIRMDEDAAERLAEAIQKDAANDEEALEVLERSSEEVDALIDAVDGAVGKAEDVTSGGAPAGTVKEAVEKIEDEAKEAEDTITDVEDATEKCEDCNVKELTEEMQAEEAKAPSSSQSVEEEIAVEKKEEKEVELKAEVSKDAAEEEPSKEKGQVVSKSKLKEDNIEEEPKLEADNNSNVGSEAEKEEESNLKADSSSQVEGKKEATLETKSNSNAGDEAGQAKDLDLKADSSSSKLEGEVESSDRMSSEAVSNDTDLAGGEASAESPEATIMASADQDGAGTLGDVAASAADRPLEGMQNALANVGSVASEVGDSIASSSSDSLHETAAATTEALAEAVAVFSSTFL